MKSKVINPLIRPILGALLFLGYIIIMLAVQGNAYGFKNKQAMNGILGLIMGYILQRGFFGFAGTSARTGKGNPHLAYAVLGMFGVTAIIVAMLASSGNPMFAGAVSKHARTIGLGTILGSMIFGAGMILAGACASGALTDMSSGTTRVAIVLIFFVIGAGPGQMIQKTLAEDIGTGGKINSLAAYLSGSGAGSGAAATAWGYFGAVLLTFVMLATLAIVAYLVSKKIRETRNINIDTLRVGMGETPDVYEEWAKMSNVSNPKSVLWKLHFNVFAKKLSLLTTAFAFGGLMIAAIALNGKGWGVTTSFARTFDWVFRVNNADTGLTYKAPGADSGTWRNIGLMIGAISYMLSANKFKVQNDFKKMFTLNGLKTFGIAAAAGFMLGFGARIADGCNAGQWATGVITFSLSGWIFGIFMTVGAALTIFFVHQCRKRKC